MTKFTKSARKITFGLDLGKKYSQLFGLAPDGEVVAQERLSSTVKRFREYFDVDECFPRKKTIIRS